MAHPESSNAQAKKLTSCRSAMRPKPETKYHSMQSKRKISKYFSKRSRKKNKISKKLTKHARKSLSKIQLVSTDASVWKSLSTLVSEEGDTSEDCAAHFEEQGIQNVRFAVEWIHRHTINSKRPTHTLLQNPFETILGE